MRWGRGRGRRGGTRSVIVRSLQTVLDYDCEWAFRQSWMTVNDAPEWDPDILSTRILRNASESCRVFRAVTWPRALGLVASRDFVAVECHERVGEARYWAVVGVEAPEEAPEEGVVRGRVDPGGGFAFSPHGEDGKKTLFRLVPMMELDVPFLPRAFVKKLLLARQRKFVALLRDRLSDLHFLS
ncbi:unnamed protein product [Darwinula stevensoni]|uniref:START domain-containing protein n=1 Tax=Darwinula stevensoni TaxID=69355 RepID=A0A7R9ACL7_9CRUS|nr:unnamed protein product [Darwinula stevensoni]CAG0900495.1 unnamed protein product [Darwinula stevensoni]